MARQTILDEAMWHELRAGNVGASDVAALFDCGFQSRFQLWHQKRGTLAREDLGDNERVVLGRCLEGGIATAASELFGLNLYKADCYVTDDTTPGLASTPDYFLNDNGVEIPVEVKNASWGAWKDNWLVAEDGFVEPPLRYLLQVQTQLACLNAPRGILVALISGDRLVRCNIERHQESIGEIRRRVTAFWESVAAGEEPAAQLPRDLDAMKGAWSAGEGSVDLSGDPDIETWLATIAELRQNKKNFEHEIDLIEGKILTYCVNNGYAAVRAHAGRISVKQRPAKPARMIEYKASDSRIEMRITTTKAGD
jgi:predicted phage-related endonuclease